MASGVRIAGVWRNLSAAYVRVGGAWRLVPTVKARVGGVWKSAAILASVTIPSNWGSGSGAIGPITSAAKALTVPSPNPGNVRLRYSVLNGSPTLQYRKNAGAYTAYADGDIVAFVNTDTLTFRMTGGSLDSANMSAEDATTGAAIGSFQADIT